MKTTVGRRTSTFIRFQEKAIRFNVPSHHPHLYSPRQHLDTNPDQQNSWSWMDFLISWAALPWLLRATSRMCEQFEIWEHHPLWETSGPSVLITCSQTEADVTSDEYERRTASLLTMIYSSRATVGKICKTDCWFSDLIVSIALSLKHSHSVCRSAKDCSSFSLLPPSPNHFSSAQTRVVGVFVLFFLFFAFVYLVLCSGLSHYLSKWWRSLPAGS